MPAPSPASVQANSLLHGKTMQVIFLRQHSQVLMYLAKCEVIMPALQHILLANEPTAKSSLPITVCDVLFTTIAEPQRRKGGRRLPPVLDTLAKCYFQSA